MEAVIIRGVLCDSMVSNGAGYGDCNGSGDGKG